MDLLIKQYGGVIVTSICAIIVLATVIMTAGSINRMAVSSSQAINLSAEAWDVDSAAGEDIVLSDSDNSVIASSINSITSMQSQINEIATQNTQAEKEIANISEKLLNLEDIYPVGSVYLTYENITPTDKFGGDWEKMTDIAPGIHAWKRLG